MPYFFKKSHVIDGTIFSLTHAALFAIGKTNKPCYIKRYIGHGYNHALRMEENDHREFPQVQR